MRSGKIHTKLFFKAKCFVEKIKNREKTIFRSLTLLKFLKEEK